MSDKTFSQELQQLKVRVALISQRLMNQASMNAPPTVVQFPDSQRYLSLAKLQFDQVHSTLSALQDSVSRSNAPPGLGQAQPPPGIFQAQPSPGTIHTLPPSLTSFKNASDQSTGFQGSFPFPSLHPTRSIALPMVAARTIPQPPTFPPPASFLAPPPLPPPATSRWNPGSFPLPPPFPAAPEQTASSGTGDLASAPYNVSGLKKPSVTGPQHILLNDSNKVVPQLVADSLRPNQAAPIPMNAQDTAKASSPRFTSDMSTLPTGPAFWQLYTALRSEVRGLSGRVASAERSVSDLEDRVDSFDPTCLTPHDSNDEVYSNNGSLAASGQNEKGDRLQNSTEGEQLSTLSWSNSCFGHSFKPSVQKASAEGAGLKHRSEAYGAMTSEWRQAGYLFSQLDKLERNMATGLSPKDSAERQLLGIGLCGLLNEYFELKGTTLGFDDAQAEMAKVQVKKRMEFSQQVRKGNAANDETRAAMKHVNDPLVTIDRHRQEIERSEQAVQSELQKQQSLCSQLEAELSMQRHLMADLTLERDSAIRRAHKNHVPPPSVSSDSETSDSVTNSRILAVDPSRPRKYTSNLNQMARRGPHPSEISASGLGYKYLVQSPLPSPTLAVCGDEIPFELYDEAPTVGEGKNSGKKARQEEKVVGINEDSARELSVPVKSNHNKTTRGEWLAAGQVRASEPSLSSGSVSPSREIGQDSSDNGTAPTSTGTMQLLPVEETVLGATPAGPSRSEDQKRDDDLISRPPLPMPIPMPLPSRNAKDNGFRRYNAWRRPGPLGELPRRSMAGQSDDSSTLWAERSHV